MGSRIELFVYVYVCVCVRVRVRVRLLPMRQLLLMELSDKIRCGWRVKLSGYEII